MHAATVAWVCHWLLWIVKYSRAAPPTEDGIPPRRNAHAAMNMQLIIRVPSGLTSHAFCSLLFLKHLHLAAPLLCIPVHTIDLLLATFALNESPAIALRGELHCLSHIFSLISHSHSHCASITPLRITFGPISLTSHLPHHASWRIDLYLFLHLYSQVCGDTCNCATSC
jgi:hypothetical protein